jgi:hypothetical protein
MKDAKKWWRSVNNKSELLSRYYGNADHRPSNEDIEEMYLEEMVDMVCE